MEEGKEMEGWGRSEEKGPEKEQEQESTWLSPPGKSDWTKPPCLQAADYLNKGHFPLVQGAEGRMKAWGPPVTTPLLALQTKGAGGKLG